MGKVEDQTPGLWRCVLDAFVDLLWWLPVLGFLLVPWWVGSVVLLAWWLGP
jgi:hypothetical protein